MSNTPFGSPLLPGQAYWPMGDIYPLTPQWGELHAPRSLVVGPESAITYDMLVPYGFDWNMTVTLTDLGDVLDLTWWYPGDDAVAAADDTVPSGFVRCESSITRAWGWSGPQRFTITQVLDDDDLWTGGLKVSVPLALQNQIGVYEPWSYIIRTILDSGDGAYPVYTLIGTVVVRP